MSVCLACRHAHDATDAGRPHQQRCTADEVRGVIGVGGRRPGIDWKQVKLARERVGGGGVEGGFEGRFEGG